MSQCLRTRNGFSHRNSLRIESLERRDLLSANAAFAAADTGDIVAADCRDAASATSITLPVTSPALTIAEAPTVTVGMPVSDLPEGAFRPFGRPFPPLHVVANPSFAEPAESVTGPEADLPVDCGSQTPVGELVATAPVAVVPVEEVTPSLPAEPTLGSEVLSVDKPAFGETSQQPVDNYDVFGPMPQVLEDAAAISTVLNQDADLIGSRVAAPMLRDPC